MGLRLIAFCMCVVFVLLVALQTARAAGTELVHFDSAPTPPTPLQLRQAKVSGAEKKAEPGLPIWGHISKPNGEGPFPAVVLMHGCAGIFPTYLRWAKYLNELGYVTLILDSFRPRSVFNICTNPFNKASPQVRALDAHGALNYLQNLDFIDPDRVAVIGWSHGGNGAMESVSSFGAVSNLPGRFKAAIAFYPFCLANWRFDIPTLILMGEKDDWVPLNACVGLHSQNQSESIPVELVTYPDVHHAYDDEELKKGISVEGFGGKEHMLKYDKDAHKDSMDRVREFLSKHVLGS